MVRSPSVNEGFVLVLVLASVAPGLPTEPKEAGLAGAVVDLQNVQSGARTSGRTSGGQPETPPSLSLPPRPPPHFPTFPVSLISKNPRLSTVDSPWPDSPPARPGLAASSCRSSLERASVGRSLAPWLRGVPGHAQQQQHKQPSKQPEAAGATGATGATGVTVVFVASVASVASAASVVSPVRALSFSFRAEWG